MDVPSLSMADKVVVITGGRTGIGKALALAFAKAGADVAVCSRSDKGGELQAVADEIRKLGQRALAMTADVSCKADVERLVTTTVAEIGNIDILINNAGILVKSMLLDIEEEVWDQVMNINLKGCLLCSQAVGRLMVEQQKGAIINIASISSFGTWPLEGAYSVSKAGVYMLTKALARELASANVRVNAIAPWIIKTQLNAPYNEDPEYIKAAEAMSPMGRIGKTDDVIGAALFLASDSASWITGHTLVVDGGYLT